MTVKSKLIAGTVAAAVAAVPFALTPSASAATPLVIKSHNGQYLTALGTKSGTTVGIRDRYQTAKNRKYQQWTILRTWSVKLNINGTPETWKAYQLKNVQAGKCLAASHSGGYTVKITTCQPGESQRWAYVRVKKWDPAKKKYYYYNKLVPLNTKSRRLSYRGDKTAFTESSNSEKRQRFTIYKAA
jgi:Ricin-type beta-trefoil lectin domain-like